MQLAYRTPQELVEGLHARQPLARRQLQSLLREPVDRLMRELILHHGLKEDPDLVVDHALHLGQTILRFRPANAFANLSWQAFLAFVLAQVGRLALQPYGSSAGTASGPGPLPSSTSYDHETYFRPIARLGHYFFGGDWYAGRELDDGSLWILLADVTGHGYYAYLLASALPVVWQRCWQVYPETCPEPAELLACMHEMLTDCLPEGIFLECTLARFAADGQVTVAPAGSTRLLVRPRRGTPDLVKLRGAWLGLRPPTCEEQHTLRLDQGDELVLVTDGVFDQLDEEGNADVVAELLDGQGCTFENLRRLIEASLASVPQRDDITMVLLRRHSPESAILPFPGTQQSGYGDVPV